MRMNKGDTTKCIMSLLKDNKKYTVLSDAKRKTIIIMEAKNDNNR